MNNNKKIIVILVVLLIAVITCAILINKNSNVTNDSYITAKNDSIMIDLSKTKKISVSYLSNNKDLNNKEKRELLNDLLNFNYPIIREEQLMVSTDYKIDFNNGILFTFGNSGREADVYENNKKRFTLEIPEDILNKIRKIFNKLEDKSKTQYNELHNIIIVK